ncbi:AMP-binding protein [Neobacillus sp. OS1-32]|uniref:AMP-binding protein n=1 Tax=Neobacillus sp. OS1-32 TaxID=3070682 RepID=UPI0027E1B55B|nr:AMP-binding protein [Neobacillus sp. OS1-32]WML31262.1 AMP-binding protein [Neobacillus sp. OS1-32]
MPPLFINEKLKQEYYDKGYWSTSTVFDHFFEAVNKFPDQIASVDNTRKLTYKQLLVEVNKTVNGLKQLQVKKGDFISVQLPNWVENVIIYLACAKIGAIYNPIPITARLQELKYIISLCESKVLFIPELYRNFNYMNLVKNVQRDHPISHVIVVRGDLNNEESDAFIYFEELQTYLPTEIGQDDQEVKSDDLLVVLFTSGTESMPKGVVHTHNTILFVVKSMIETLFITKDDTVFMPSPVSHATGFLYGMNLPLTIGAKSVLMEHFVAKEALKMITEEKCTFSMGATPFLHDLLIEITRQEGKINLDHFRFFLCGGAPIPRHLVNEANKIGFKVLAVYGSSESPPHTVSRLDDSDELILSSDGKPVPGIDVKIVDNNHEELPDGEIGEEASRGPNVFLGYLKQPELTQKYLDHDGWYYSGDLCVLLPEQYIRVVGRKKDIIIRGGQNISPGEVEEILYRHPKVQQVAIIGVPDERMGEKAWALVVPVEGEKLTFAEMIEFLSQQNIAKYKYPEKLRLVSDLPRTSSGKIQKYKLREMVEKDLGIISK